ncbi:hypothetical protein K7X08_037539 [Anisodus acutangulus]|uniref:Uncharacterized protein n=1 Tax=Anisodus acutangulus TaxID=402998 RepID=A0A9Q1RPI5_9SOLA|nr:hypothetical protein K7X08_037539 [Anisodus acutangulus]
MVQKVAFHLLLLFIFATIISTASSSRILKESIDETSAFDLPVQDANDITVDDADFFAEEVSVARRMDLVLDYASPGANNQHNPTRP